MQHVLENLGFLSSGLRLNGFLLTDVNLLYYFLALSKSQNVAKNEMVRYSLLSYVLCIRRFSDNLSVLGGLRELSQLGKVAPLSAAGDYQVDDDDDVP